MRETYMHDGIEILTDASKRERIREVGRRYALDVLVETGTYRGDTVAALLDDFKRIVTIELSPELARAASLKFGTFKHVSVMCGSSGACLPRVDLQTSPILFWLDAHYSGGVTARGETDCPLLEELAIVMRHAHPGSVVLIDDIRLMGAGDYPTLEQIRTAAPGCESSVEDDIMQIEAQWFQRSRKALR